MANKVASCFERSINVSDSISLKLEASLSDQGSCLIDLFFLSTTLYSSNLQRFIYCMCFVLYLLYVLIYLNCPRIKYYLLNQIEIIFFRDASLRCNIVRLSKRGRQYTPILILCKQRHASLFSYQVKVEQQGCLSFIGSIIIRNAY